MSDPIVLPVSGKKATVHRIKGSNIVNAAKTAGPDATNVERGFALLAEQVELDGRQANYFDILDLDGEDIAFLQGAIETPSSPSPQQP